MYVYRETERERERNRGSETLKHLLEHSNMKTEALMETREVLYKE